MKEENSTGVMTELRLLSAGVDGAPRCYQGFEIERLNEDIMNRRLQVWFSNGSYLVFTGSYMIEFKEPLKKK